MLEQQAPSGSSLAPWDRLRLIDTVIPLDSGRENASLRLEGDRLVFETHGRAFALRSWPRLEAFRRGAGGAWTPTDRYADEILSCWWRLEPGAAPERDPFSVLTGTGRAPSLKPGRVDQFWPAYVFFERIPEPLLREASRFRSRRWHLLRLFSADPRFFELCLSNPGLAFALASAWRLRPSGAGGAEALPGRIVEWKRRDILGWLGFPGTGAAERTLRKIEPVALDIGRLLRLRGLMAEAEAQAMLSRLPSINCLAIDALAAPRSRALLTPRLLAELADRDCEECPSCYDSHLIEGFDRISGLSRALGLARPRDPFVSLARLWRCQDELAARVKRRLWAERAATATRAFAAPPFAGDAEIVPIRTEAELFAEGLEMENCVPTYLGEILKGKAYFYRVLSPQRATLLVKREPGGERSTWDCAEIEGPRNTPIPPDVGEGIWLSLRATWRPSDGDG